MSSQVSNFYTLLFPFTLIFWVWALINTIRAPGGWDYGIATFGFALVTTSYVLGTRAAGGLPNGFPRILVTASHILVAVNYVIGVIFSFHTSHNTGYGIYCIVFAILWSGIAVRGRKIILDADDSLP